MIETLGAIVLKSGEQVEALVVHGPDLEWRERVLKLLGHKSAPWYWQNTELLSEDVGIDAYFYLLHHGGEPFANIMTAEREGVGIFGHVWTNPEWRGKGAAGQLQEKLMAHFRERGGRALFLGTGFDSMPFHLYAKYGFEPVEPGSGYMTWTAQPKAVFEAEYFAPEDSFIESLDWPHWPASPALFLADVPGLVRCAPLRILGRQSTEGTLLPVLQYHRTHSDDPAQALALRSATGAVVGLAVWGKDAFWPHTVCVDVFCHPNFWHRGLELLNELRPHGADRFIAYTDSTCPEKREILQHSGFRPIAELPNWLAVDELGSSKVDVTMFEKN